MRILQRHNAAAVPHALCLSCGCERGVAAVRNPKKSRKTTRNARLSKAAGTPLRRERCAPAGRGARSLREGAQDAKRSKRQRQYGPRVESLDHRARRRSLCSVRHLGDERSRQAFGHSANAVLGGGERRSDWRRSANSAASDKRLQPAGIFRRRALLVIIEVDVAALLFPASATLAVTLRKAHAARRRVRRRGVRVAARREAPCVLRVVGRRPRLWRRASIRSAGFRLASRARALRWSCLRPCA